MELKDALVPALTAGLGYFAGRESAESKVIDPEQSQELIAMLQQRIALMDAKNLASAALVAALKDESETGQLVQAQLQAQLADLNAKLSSQQAAIFSNFPVVFGAGDPSLGGWIKGRDGLLISRALPNFVPGTNGYLATATGYGVAPPATGIAVSDVSLKAAARPISIGKSMNTSLAIVLKRGYFGGMSAILNFAEDVADDPDFIASAWVHDGSYRAHVVAIPIGRNSLLLTILGTSKTPSGHTAASWNGLVVRDATVADPIPTKAQRSSWGSGAVCITLAHRTARNLTLRSWGIVANPLAQYMETNAVAWDDASLSHTRRAGNTTILSRINTGALPRFYRVDDENMDYTTVDLSSSAYM
ncbi:putative host attachment protein [Pseudomonas phage phiYY]|uniref:Putative host attachment protein n=1 Tax=Pseudomonas phage phiYY TaxID=1852644 RepID=A0A1W2KDS4_9VIRU|nr:putative host attachment protein [Pseudomonas phage phiYY]ANM47308.1 putative host attachment protein [Pseudomonas phage phiYY]